MSHLRRASIAMALSGILLIIATLALDLASSWLLAGIMLILAGTVKVVVVAIWTRLAAMDDPTPSP